MDLRGVYPALMSPFKKDGSFDFDVLRKLLRELMKTKIRGFYVGGSSAELFSLTMDERKKVAEVAREEAGSDRSVIAHIGAMNPADAIDLAVHAKKTGCDAISAIPPFYGKYSWEETSAFYKSLIDASGLKIFLYNIPAFTGVNLSIGGYKELLSTGMVAGVKHTSPSLSDLERLKVANPEGIVFAGYDDLLCAAIAMGAEGCIGTGVNAVPDYFLNIFDYMKKGNLAAAQKTQCAMNSLGEALNQVGFFKGVKYLLQLKGIDVGACRPPFLPLNAAQKKTVEEAYASSQALVAATVAANPL